MLHVENNSGRCATDSSKERKRSMCRDIAPVTYWGLRDYGVAPAVWGGEPSCEHEWASQIKKAGGAYAVGSKKRWQHSAEDFTRDDRFMDGHPEIPAGAFCSCGAWRGVLGLEPTPQLYVEHVLEVFREIWRVLRKDGVVFLNLGDSYATGAGKASSAGGGAQGERFLESGPSGYRGAHDLSPKHAQVPDRKNPGAMIPTYQPNRMPIPGLKPKDLCMIPARVALALQAAGWWLRSDIIWSKNNPMPESVTDRPTKAHEYIFLLTKNERYFFDQDAVREPVTCDRMRGSGPMTNPLNGDRNDSDQRGDYRLRTKKPDGWATHSGGHGSIHKNGREKGEAATIDLSAGRNIRSVWTMATQPFPEAHFATFPEELAERCIKAGSRPGSIVLDPFGGAGTTALVADKLGRVGISLELKAEYCAMAKKRIFSDAPLMATL